MRTLLLGGIAKTDAHQGAVGIAVAVLLILAHMVMP